MNNDYVPVMLCLFQITSYDFIGSRLLISVGLCLIPERDKGRHVVTLCIDEANSKFYAPVRLKMAVAQIFHQN